MVEVVKQVEVEREVEVERIVEVPVEVERIVEVFHEVPVEKIVEVEKLVGMREEDVEELKRKMRDEAERERQRIMQMKDATAAEKQRQIEALRGAPTPPAGPSGAAEAKQWQKDVAGLVSGYQEELQDLVAAADYAAAAEKKRQI